MESFCQLLQIMFNGELIDFRPKGAKSFTNSPIVVSRVLTNRKLK